MGNYFVVMRANNNSYPLLMWMQKKSMFLTGTPVQISEPIKLGLGDPIPNNPQMVDYHSLPKPVVSEKIKNILEPMNIEGIQLVPAKVQGIGEKIYDYWLIHVYNEIFCMDKNRSTYKQFGCLFDISKFTLDEEILNDIPLEKRLIFLLGESTNLHIFHKSIRDAIMSENPQGIKFVNVDEWTDGSAFD